MSKADNPHANRVTQNITPVASPLSLQDPSVLKVVHPVPGKFQEINLSCRSLDGHCHEDAFSAHEEKANISK